jgi:hypothetical protein
MVKRIDYLGSLTLVLGVSLELALLLFIILTNIVFLVDFALRPARIFAICSLAQER